MALVECKECGGKVAMTAATCPHCGVSAPALSASEKASAVAVIKNSMARKAGGWAFIAGVAWMLSMIATGANKDSIEPSWDIAKYLIGGGAAVYIWSELLRNFSERKARKVK